MLSIRVTGLREAVQAMEDMKARTEVASRGIVAESAAVVEARAKGMFAGSHRRGQPHVGGNRPNVVSGMLRRSIGHDPIVRTGPGSYQTRVGPRAVYGRRVELGFTGVDVRGRSYNQRGYPFLQPAAVQSRAAMALIAQRRWGSVL